MELVEKMLQGEQFPLSRLITLAEHGGEEVAAIMKAISPHLGKAYSVGVTGPPGAGKSTLVDKLTAAARRRGLSVGIVAVDPTSPFSGGAVLGDRIRMQQHYLDQEVFIRSMATRGSRGGLPTSARDVIKILDAFGKDLILVETVGVGQTELDVIETVDTTVVVLVPEAGDTIQTMKAGLMEIADVFVVNKADRPGADRAVAELEAMLMLGPRGNGWQPPVLATQASNDIGIEPLFQAMENHREFLRSTGDLHRQRQRQRRDEFMQIVGKRISRRLQQLILNNDRMIALVAQVDSGELDPYSAADIIETEVLPQI